MSIPVAFFTYPHPGGVYSKYRLLRDGLARRGYEVGCWTFGAQWREERVGARRIADYSDPGDRWIAPAEPDLAAAAAECVDQMTVEGVRVVLPMADRSAISMVRHLPTDMRVVTACYEITPWGYATATAVMDRTHRLVATSPRQRNDLLARHGVPAASVTLIPLSVDAVRFGGPAAKNRRAGHSGSLTWEDCRTG